MSGADWVIIAIILVSIIQAAKAGFFHEAFGIGGLVLGYLLAAWPFTPTSKWLEESAFAPYFLVVGRAAIWLAPSELRARFYTGLDMLHQQELGAGAARGSRSGK